MARQLQARDLLVSIDRSSRAPIARQIEDQLRRAIRTGLLIGGSQLPSTRALAQDLSVSRGVVVRAYAQLSTEGYIELRQGANPRVRRPVEVARASAAVGEPQRPRRPRFDLRPGVPDLGAFPRHAWLRSQTQALATAPDGDLGYVDSRGLERLRVQVAHYVGRARGVATTPDRVLITAGSTHSLSLIARALARRGARSIGFENPSHVVLREVAERAGLHAVGFPVDEEGLVVEELAGSSVPAVVVSPAHQYPTGRALSGSRRAALARWAVDHDAFIVEDDFDAEFRYDRAAVGALQGLAPERVLYLGSASKTLAPGLRVGWAVLPSSIDAEVVDELSRSMLQTSTLDQLAFENFLRAGELDRHLRKMRVLYRRRRDAVVRALEQELPGLRVGGIAAGLHLVLELDSYELEQAVYASAREWSIALESISEHALPGYEGPYGLLLGYGALSEPAIREAIRELGRVFAELENEADSGPMLRVSA
jgi:GntR family transcriptional regulator / MocR family aminotransferase